MDRSSARRHPRPLTRNLPNCKRDVERYSRERFQGIHTSKSEFSQQYIFGRLTGRNIRKLAQRCYKQQKEPSASASPLYRIWLDHEVKRFTNQSISTVKADAARNAFGAFGSEIVWAVVDTGIDETHPHFREIQESRIGRSAAPSRFHDDERARPTTARNERARRPRRPRNARGGIIAGEIKARTNGAIVATVRQRDETGRSIRST